MMAKCHRCKGTGMIVNPAVDGWSTMDECAQDEDFVQGYFEGRYDIPCNICGGHGVLDMSDEAVEQRRMDEEDRRVYEMEMRLLGG